MFKAKLLKSILIPTLGISTIGSIAAISTSCGNVIHVTDVTLDETSVFLDVGATKTLTATVLPENATDKSATWTSNKPSVATVDNNGKITAVTQGTATIVVATHDGGKATTCKVTVLGQALTKYLIIAANNQDSILELKNEGGNIPDLQYSIDGTNWSKYNAPINITQGQTLYLKGNNPNGWSKRASQYSTLSITGDASITGNVMGLLDNGAASEEEGDITDIPCNYCFQHLFHGSTEITSVSEDFLPATGLTTWCYEYMFQGCTSLTKVPNLPATALDYNCYKGMFDGCTSLTKAPELPATTLEENCYDSMFSGCSSLTTAPALPATTLVTSCYLSMFQNCTSLTKAPELPATTLIDYCYDSMFSGCSSLNSIKIGYTGNYDSKYFSSWVSGVADSGTFYYNGVDSPANFGFPVGWTKSPF